MLLLSRGESLLDAVFSPSCTTERSLGSNYTRERTLGPSYTRERTLNPSYTGERTINSSYTGKRTLNLSYTRDRTLNPSYTRERTVPATQRICRWLAGDRRSLIGPSAVSGRGTARFPVRGTSRRAGRLAWRAGRPLCRRNGHVTVVCAGRACYWRRGHAAAPDRMSCRPAVERRSEYGESGRCRFLPGHPSERPWRPPPAAHPCGQGVLWGGPVDTAVGWPRAHGILYRVAPWTRYTV